MPVKEVSFSECSESKCISAENASTTVKRFPPLSTISIKGVHKENLESLLLRLIRRNYFFYKVTIKDHLFIGDRKANMIIDSFLKAGYIRKDEHGKKLYCNLTMQDFCQII